MPPARALVDAGAAIALATDFNPGARSRRACRSSARSPAHSCTWRRRRRSSAMTVNAAHVLGRADRRTARAGLARRLSSSTRPTGATSPTTSPATSSRRSSAPDGRAPALTWARCRAGSNAAAAYKDFRHDVRVSRSTRRETRSRSPSCGRRSAAARRQAARRREAPGAVASRGRPEPPPTWDRAFKRGGHDGRPDASRCSLP